jgi:RES domain-containing protein
MARKPSRPRTPKASPTPKAAPLLVDPDPARLRPNTAPKRFEISAGAWLQRVHHQAFGADQFNPTDLGDARFSPIRDDQGVIIPTIYAAETRECAAMETAFHDVPVSTGLKTKEISDLEPLRHSTIEVHAALSLADLSTKGLHRLGLNKKDVIETEADEYPRTRAFAEHMHRAHPDIQGLSWVSRRDDTSRAFVLFGDRVPADALSQVGDSKGLVSDEQTFEAMLELAEDIGLSLVGPVKVPTKGG